MFKKLLFISVAFSILAFNAVGADAATWSAPTKVMTAQVTSLDNIPLIAGTPFTAPKAGACASPGEVYRYYVTSGWLCRFDVCRGVLTVSQQVCS